MIKIEKWETVETPPSPAVQAPEGYWVSFSHLAMGLTYEWVLNHPVGREEADIFI